MNNSLISIAVPVYNSEKYLVSCLNSLIAQTYDNLEIVVLNNGSTDNSLSIIERFAEKDSRIKYFTISHVPTEAWSRNNAFVRTTGEWIVPVDSDDYITPGYVERLWERHLETGAEWVGSTMTLVDKDGHEYGRIPEADFDYSQVRQGRDSVILTLGGWKINANGALIHRHLISCIESGDPKPSYNWEYDSRILMYKSSKVAFADVQYFYGYNPNSVGRKPSFARATYVIVSYSGLYPFILSHYDASSNEVKVMTAVCWKIIEASYKNYKELRKTITKDEREEYKRLIYILYQNMSFHALKGGLLKKTMKIIVMWINMILLRFF